MDIQIKVFQLVRDAKSNKGIFKHSFLQDSEKYRPVYAELYDGYS